MQENPEVLEENPEVFVMSIKTSGFKLVADMDVKPRGFARENPEVLVYAERPPTPRFPSRKPRGFNIVACGNIIIH